MLQIRDYKSDDNSVYIPVAEKHKTCTEKDIMIGRYWPPVFQILRWKAGAYNVALIKCIIDEEKITEGRLYHFLSSKPIQEHIISLSERIRQSWVLPSDLGDLDIPLPPIEVQEQIVAQLDEEQRIINENRKLITMLDDKIQQIVNRVRGE